MEQSTELEFLKRWIATLDVVEPGIRGKMNSVSICMTGYFVGIGVDGKVSIDHVEGWNGQRQD